MTDEQDVKIAVLNNQLESLKEMQKLQIDGLREQGKSQFDKLVGILDKQNESAKSLREYIKPAVEFATVNKDMPAQVKVLWDFHQQNKGFLSATRLITAAVGGGVVALADFLWKR